MTLFWPPPLPLHLLLCVPTQFTSPILLATSEPRLSRRPWYCPTSPMQKESLPFITAPHLFRDAAHFPLRPGVRCPKLWAPHYHVLISASPILPNKAILWRCGSLRKTNSSADGFMKSYKYTDPNTYRPICRQTIIPQKSHVILVDLCFMAWWIHSAHSFIEMESAWHLYLLVLLWFNMSILRLVLVCGTVLF